MIKKANNVILCFLLSFIGYSQQTKTEDLEKEISSLKEEIDSKNSTIDDQKITIKKLNEQIVYYKEALNLINSKISTTDKDVNFKINSIIGSLSTGEVIITGILNNNGVTRSLQGSQAISVDPQGNIIKTYDVSFVNEKRIDKLGKDIPIKFRIIFKEIIAETPMLKELSVKFHSTMNYRNDDIYIVFNNLDIDWK